MPKEKSPEIQPGLFPPLDISDLGAGRIGRTGPATLPDMESDAPEVLLFLELRERFPAMFMEGDLLGICPAPGWRKIISSALERIEELDPGAKVVMCREKMGELRLVAYADIPVAQEGIYAIVRKATAASRKMCLVCGQPAELTELPHRLRLTICPDCQAAGLARRYHRLPVKKLDDMKHESKILVVGDLHGDFAALNRMINKKHPGLVLQCGDFGYFPKEAGFDPAKHLRTAGVKVHWCDGNHEDHDELAKFRSDPPTGHEVSEDCIYQERGSTLTLPDGRVVDSIDKHQRKVGFDWFPSELLTEADLARMPDRKIDIVISHTFPACFGLRRKPGPMDHYPLKLALADPSEEILSAVFERYQPRLWYFGHWHKQVIGKFQGCKWMGMNYAGRTGWWTWLPEQGA